VSKKAGAIISLCAVLLKASAANAEPVYQVEAQAAAADAPRLGINLGDEAAWGRGAISPQYPEKIPALKAS
jgi:hypothetical protein